MKQLIFIKVERNGVTVKLKVVYFLLEILYKLKPLTLQERTLRLKPINSKLKKVLNMYL